MVDIKARDNLGKLPRHYLQKDRFTDQQNEHLSRVIGKIFYYMMHESLIHSKQRDLNSFFISNIGGSVHLRSWFDE
jgi:hypothetical protein